MRKSVWPLKIKIIMTLIFSILLCGVLAVGTATYFKNKEFQQGLIEKSRVLHGRLQVAAMYVAKQGGLKPLIERFTTKYQSPKDLTQEDRLMILQQVPIYAAMEMGRQNSEKDHYQFRVFSDEPRNPENKASLDEKEIFEKFQKDPQLEEWVETTTEALTVYRPIRMKATQGCLACHGDPAQSPWGNGLDILGHQMENWTDGKLRGVFAISNNLKVVQAAAMAEGRGSSTGIMTLLIGFGGIVGLMGALLFLNKPIDHLYQAVASLDNTGSHVFEVSHNITSSAHQLATSSSQQASSLQETVSTMEELTSQVQLNTHHSQEAAQLATSMREVALKGETDINWLISSIQEISVDSKKIAEITSVIDDISFQTNLLALNASVEAARAGEQGRGFAVVAEAVRNLAQRSASAAKDIEKLVRESTDKVSQSSQRAEQSRQILNDIVTSVKKVADLNAEIAVASKEQSNGISQMNIAINRLDESTQGNSSIATISSKSSEVLTQECQHMSSAIEKIHTVVLGHSRDII